MLGKLRQNAIFIYTDSGRLCHPVYYINGNKKVSINNKYILDKIYKTAFTWNELVSGFSKKKADFDINNCTIYLNIKDLYPIIRII